MERTAYRIFIALVALLSACSDNSSSSDGRSRDASTVKPDDVDASDVSTVEPVDVDASDGDATDDDGGVAMSVSRGRLFVSVRVIEGGEEVSRVESFDLDDGKSLGILPRTPRRIYADARARYGILDFAREENEKDRGFGLLDPGIHLAERSVDKKGPELLSALAPIDRVLNVDVGTRWFGVFEENGTRGLFIDTTKLPDLAAEVVNLNGGLSLTDPDGAGGQAVSWGDDRFVSVVSAGDPLFPAGPRPVAMARVDGKGEKVEEYACAGGLGFGHNEQRAIFVCSADLLSLKRNGSGFASERLQYPSEQHACYDVVAAPRAPALVVSCSDASTYFPLPRLLVDSETGEVTEIEGSADLWSIHVLERGDGFFAVGLDTLTGDLVGFALSDGKEAFRLKDVVLPFPQPPFAWSWLSGDRLFAARIASAPDTKHEIVEVDVGVVPPKVVRTLKPAGLPGRLVVLGRTP